MRMPEGVPYAEIERINLMSMSRIESYIALALGAMVGLGLALAFLVVV